MLRELVEALEELTAEQGLVLWLEDLHWSDVSTLEWLSYVARRAQPVRLLIVGTLRPVEILATAHPLRAVTQELRLHRYCEELRLSFLTEAHVAEYLTQRFGMATDRNAPLHEIVAVIHRRTEGNPLFMVNVVEQLIEQGMLGRKDENWDEQAETTYPDVLLPSLAAVQLGVPRDIQQLIERQIEHVSVGEQQILEAASVAGLEFSAAAVAAALAADIQEVEQHCATLARHECFLQTNGTEEWVDGSAASRYRFIHALHQEVLYDRVTAARRVHWHLRIGMRKEQGYGTRMEAKTLLDQLA
jgi:predicted ATPase